MSVTMRAANERQVLEPTAITISGCPIILDCSGVIFLPQTGVLVVSDLHLEKASSLARRRNFLPPYDTRATLLRLAKVVEVYQPQTIVSLGDSFHDTGGADRLGSDDQATMVSIMTGRNWLWVAGNHDPEPPSGLPGIAISEIAIDGLLLRHEPDDLAPCGEVAGHLHPGARIVQRGRSIRRPCFATDGKRLVMPAFGSFTGSLNVLDKAFQGLFNPADLAVFMLGDGRVFPVANNQLRPD